MYNNRVISTIPFFGNWQTTIPPTATTRLRINNDRCHTHRTRDYLLLEPSLTISISSISCDSMYSPYIAPLLLHANLIRLYLQHDFATRPFDNITPFPTKHITSNCSNVTTIPVPTTQHSDDHIQNDQFAMIQSTPSILQRDIIYSTLILTEWPLFVLNNDVKWM